MNIPSIPLPEPMTAIDPNSWAYDTVTRRWPEIAKRILVENELAPTIWQRIQELINDIPDFSIRNINDPAAPDSQAWNQNIRKNNGKGWLEPPWFFTEHYFYRRVIEAIGYFHSSEGEGLDPFSYQKQHGLDVSRDKIRDMVERVTPLVKRAGDLESLILLIYLDLWGNQADLSMWPADGAAKPDHLDLEHAREYLLEDRTVEIADMILKTFKTTSERPEIRVDFIVDNAGFELVSDLVFADYLLNSEIAGKVRLHVKPHPTYVSDAMVKDVSNTLDFLRSDLNHQVNSLGGRLLDNWGTGRLQVIENFFWTSPLSGWEMPLPLAHELSQSSLVISKGDANYRRLLGDLDWPYTTPFSDILAYFPAPVVALRTVKAEIACGMQPGQSNQVAAVDPHWMTDGRWGMVQFCIPGISAG